MFEETLPQATDDQDVLKRTNGTKKFAVLLEDGVVVVLLVHMTHMNPSLCSSFAYNANYY